MPFSVLIRDKNRIGAESSISTANRPGLKTRKSDSVQQGESAAARSFPLRTGDWGWRRLDFSLQSVIL